MTLEDRGKILDKLRAWPKKEVRQMMQADAAGQLPPSLHDTRRHGWDTGMRP